MGVAGAPVSLAAIYLFACNSNTGNKGAIVVRAKEAYVVREANAVTEAAAV